MVYKFISRREGVRGHFKQNLEFPAFLVVVLWDVSTMNLLIPGTFGTSVARTSGWWVVRVLGLEVRVKSCD